MRSVKVLLGKVSEAVKNGYARFSETLKDIAMELHIGQALYMHLNLSADDDGFIDSPRRIIRMIGATER